MLSFQSEAVELLYEQLVHLVNPVPVDGLDPEQYESDIVVPSLLLQYTVLYCSPNPQLDVPAVQFTEPQAPVYQEYVHPLVEEQLVEVPGFVPEQYGSATLVPSFRRQYTIRFLVPDPQVVEHDPYEPVYQEYETHPLDSVHTCEVTGLLNP